jgi:serine O-acetyltransferase
MDRSDKQRIEGIVQRILDDFGDDRAINKTDLCNEPDKTAIIDVIDKLMKILYPGYYSDKLYKIYSLKNNMSVIIEDVIFHLKKQIMIVLRYCKKFPELTAEFMPGASPPLVRTAIFRMSLICMSSNYFYTEAPASWQ